MPKIYALTTPNTITEPANLNILAPIPVTSPSFLYSKLALIIACAKPVIGIIRPHLAKDTHLSKNPNAVNKVPKNIKVIIMHTEASLVGMSKIYE